ncbi:hypothetical protein ACRARG_09105 [Pseudooceanicola sp. C21-150M6]|uniref:hypothetical protein n=1 Tax=Pseudooceanicola sp. C21-150M6 TaxID=3434355 RepID=UPI003D7F85FD
MTTFLSKEVQDGLRVARKRAVARSRRLRVVIGDERYPILKLWDGGFAVAGEGVPPLRGLVDVYDGGRHLWQCLIVAVAEEAGEMNYEFKRQTAVDAGPALDFERAEQAPVALIPRF